MAVLEGPGFSLLSAEAAGAVRMEMRSMDSRSGRVEA